MERFNRLSSERFASLLSHVSQLRRSDVIALLSSATVLAFVGPALFKLSRAFLHQYRSPLRLVPGPKSSNFFIGNLVEIGDWIDVAESARTIGQWTETFGPIFKCKLFFNQNMLVLMDTKALNHVLSHPVEYEKPPLARKNLSSLLGQGLLVAEGDVHKQQRKLLNPAFSPVQIRELTQTFIQKANYLCDLMAIEISKAGDSKAAIDVIPWLNKVTLDIIGSTAFGYSFDALNPAGTPNELSEAMQSALKVPKGLPIFAILQAIFPPLRIIPTEQQKSIQHSHDTAFRVGRQLFEERRAAVLSDVEMGEAKGSRGGAGSEKARVLRDNVQGADLFALLVKANMATDLPDHLRMSDEDVLAQIPTFMFAGHETTSSAVTWTLLALSENQAYQAKLRTELLSVSSSTPTMDELNVLPYLDKIVRETMRLYAPVPNTVRQVMKDDVIPTQNEWVDRLGQKRQGLPVMKGDLISIQILPLNTSKAIWGDDALEFKPERWDNLPDTVRSIPGVWGNMLSFLGGNHACIGYRFSLVEMKAILFMLIRSFHFDLAIRREDIIAKANVTQKPYRKSAPDAGPQLPLSVSLVRLD